MKSIRASGVHAYTPNHTLLVSNYIINQVTEEKIVFYTLPDDISESYSASWDNSEVRGRSAPYHGYSGNEARSVSYSFTLYEDLCGESYMDIIDALKRLVYPKYNGSIVIPPYCILKIGDMVNRVTAIVNSVSVSWGGTVIEGNKHYSKADISLDYTQVYLDNSKLPSAENLFD